MSDIITARDLCLWYGQTKALNGINMDVREHSITALIGPSGCGKSTFLKTLNRMNDLIPGVKVTGEVKYENKDIFSLDVNELRKNVGMVFQKPNPFPMSIYDNIAYGPRTHGVPKAELDGIVEQSLRGGGHLGRGQGPTQKIRSRPFGRPAAAALHCQGSCRKAKGSSYGRAHKRP